MSTQTHEREIRDDDPAGDVFDHCRGCGTGLSFRGRYEPVLWLDSALEARCADGQWHEPRHGRWFRFSTPPEVEQAYFEAVAEEVERRTDARVDAEIPSCAEWTVYEEREGDIYRTELACVLADQGITWSDWSASRQVRRATMSPEEYVQAVRNEITRLSLQHPSADRLGITVTRMLAQHTEFRIYDECEHDHQQIGPPEDTRSARCWNGARPIYEQGVVLVDEIGLTCNYVYSVCSQCCTDQLHGGDQVQREDCADAGNDPFWHSCWPCQAWLDAGGSLGIPGLEQKVSPARRTPVSA